jgi:hypothetical protein
MTLPGKRLRKTESVQPLASLACPGQTGRKSRERARAKSNRKGFKGRLPFFGDEANYTQNFASVLVLREIRTNPSKNPVPIWEFRSEFQPFPVHKNNNFVYSVISVEEKSA